MDEANEYIIKRSLEKGEYEFGSSSFPACLHTDGDKCFITEMGGHGLIYPSFMIKKVIKGLEKFLGEHTDQDILEANLDDITKCFERYRKSVDHQKEKEPVIGMIYAVRCGNKIKLGRTLDLDARVKTYKKTCSDVELLGAERVHDYVMHEKVFLAEFGEPAVGAEWFNYSKEMEQKVKDYLKNVEPVLC